MDSSEASPSVEGRNVISKDMKTKNSFEEMAEKAKHCSTLVRSMTEKLKTNEVTSNKGFDFLELKNNTIFQYLVSLTGVVITKTEGKSIQGRSFIDQLLESRVVLEKMRPIERRLKYPIEKLIRNAVDGKVESDPLSYRANPDGLTSKDDGETTEGSDSDEDKPVEKLKSDIYRPPRVAPQYFDGDDEEPAKSAEKNKKKAINKFIIRELQEEFLETPIEVHNMGDAYSKQLSRESKDKQRFEETYMTRLPVTKKEKHHEKAASTIGVLGDELTDFTGRRNFKTSTTKRKNKFKKGGRSKKRMKK